MSVFNNCVICKAKLTKHATRERGICSRCEPDLSVKFRISKLRRKDHQMVEQQFTFFAERKKWYDV